MRVVGIVAEYNPFHTGHEYHLREAKRAANADYAVVVMSPDFVQRGEPAVFDKYVRTGMALRGGADLVLELPVAYASGSAEYFATGAVSLLDASGVVDALCFGAETADLCLFGMTARVLNEEPEPYRLMLQDRLRQGLTFPQARAQALEAYLNASPDMMDMKSATHERIPAGSAKIPDNRGACTKDTRSLSGLADFLASPNNILGIEYCRALQRLQSAIAPVPVSRVGSAFNSTALDDAYCSATALRHAVAEQYALQHAVTGQYALQHATAEQYTLHHTIAGQYTLQHAATEQYALNRAAAASVKTSEDSRLETALRYIPGNCRGLFEDACRQPVFADDFLPYLAQKLLTTDDFTKIADISPSLSDRIWKLRFQCIGKSFGETVELLRTKQLTESHIRRALLHLILDIRSGSEQDATDTWQADSPLRPNGAADTQQASPLRPNGATDTRQTGSLLRPNGATDAWQAGNPQHPNDSRASRTASARYARILGFRQNAAPLLHELKKKSEIPLLSKPARALSQLDAVSQEMWLQDISASHLYHAVLSQKYGLPFKTEYEYSPLRL